MGGVVISQSNGTDTIYFQYDTSGTPLGFIYNGTQFFYLTNQMGDVIGLSTEDGNVFVYYFYDEWGKLLATQPFFEENDENYDEYISVANDNPLRYRGYYYDNEIGYYYLQSRYYDPSICRFINADILEIASISKDISVGTNLFAYCSNNPINNSDPNGQLSLKTINAILESFFNLFYGYLNIIFNKIANKIGINKNKVLFSIKTQTIASAIDLISGIVSGIKGIITSLPKRLITTGLITF